MSEITIDDFIKIEMRVGLVEDVEDVDKSEKLLKLKVRFGEGEVRTIFSGIKKWYGIDDLKGKKFGFVYNLAPRKMMGEESQGMIMAFDDGNGGAVLWSVPDNLEIGSLVR